MSFFKIFSLCVCMLPCVCVVDAQTDVEPPSLLAALPEYEVVNPVIYDLLDSLGVDAESCIFILLNKPYYISLNINKIDGQITFIGAVRQYRTIVYDLKSAKNKGYFYHNGILTVAYSNIDMEDFFVYRSDSLHELYYHYRESFTPYYLKAVEMARVQYQYSDGKLNRTTGWNSRCHDRTYFFIYKIREHQTVEYLLDACGCSEEMIHYIDGEYVAELPKVGDDFIIEYRVDENRKVTANRISLQTVYEDKYKNTRFENKVKKKRKSKKRN